MADEGADQPLGGGDGPAERLREPSPWFVPIISAVVVGVFTILNGWFTYVSVTSKEMTQVRLNNFTNQLVDVKARLDRIDNRLLFLEQNRKNIADASASPEIAIVPNSGDHRAPESSPLSEMSSR